MEIIEIINEAVNWKNEACYMWPRDFTSNRPIIASFYVPGLTRKSPVTASRAIYMIAHNAPNLPRTQNVLHSCGNGEKGCVAVNHLYLGTVKDNWHDWHKHGAHRGRLTAELVRELRENDDCTNRYRREASIRLGVGFSTIADALAGRSWKDLGSPAHPAP